MQKRGFFSLKGLIMAIVVAIVILAFIQAGKSFGSMDIYFRDAVAKDIALIVDSLYATSGDATIRYGEDLSKHTVWIKDNIVAIYKTSEGKTDIIPRRYRFIGANIDETRIKNPSNLVIEKRDNKISLYNKND